MNAKANDTKRKARELCEKLHLAAKKSKTRRFHALYDKVYRPDILGGALEQVIANKGSPGVDNESIKDILSKGKETVLNELRERLKEGKYRPRKVKRIYIPKPDGRERPLGIPTVRDRTVQTATKRLLEPVFEADFLDCSYGFRPNRSAHEALEEIRLGINAGCRVVLDGDIKGFFDNINHGKLLEFLHFRISDRRILKLIRKWLECGAMDAGVVKEVKKGTPQGGVISPLLANVYLHEFDKFWTEQTTVPGKLIRYADDFVILFRTLGEAEVGLRLVREKMNELGLELHEGKTKIVDATGGRGGFDFLGFHHRMVKSRKYHRFYAQKWPSAKSMKSIRGKIRELTAKRSILSWSLERVIGRLNPVLRGWMNYFRFGNSSSKFSQIDRYVQERLVLWWSKKHQKSGRRWGVDFTYERFRRCGMQILNGNVKYWSNKSNAQGRGSSESRMRENLTYGLMRGNWICGY